ncbi:MAG: hypothetical protein Q8L60_11985 [Gammaproteobacteria bacterium]|nr:hypothetical protein [Gammaproteobacteria bacterium]MDP2347665.1 hypothetical protein [Gammaproteobacteria bacterium]
MKPLIFTLLICSSSYSAEMIEIREGPDFATAKQWLERNLSEGAQIFATSCQTESKRWVMMLPKSNREGILFYVESGYIRLLTDIRFSPNRSVPPLLETNGGIDNFLLAKEHYETLLTRGFKIFEGGNFLEILGALPISPC